MSLPIPAELHVKVKDGKVSAQESVGLAGPGSLCEAGIRRLRLGHGETTWLILTEEWDP